MRESRTERIGVTVRPYSDGDLPVLERTLGDPRMTTHLGGPESVEKLRDRHWKFTACPKIQSRRVEMVHLKIATV